MTINEFVPLAPLTTFKTGGLARYFAEIEKEEELKEAVLFAREKGVPFFILGGGSNVLVSDLGFPGLIINMKIKGVTNKEINGDIFTEVGAGEWWDDFVAYTAKNGWNGAENLSGIPGSVGAALVQNIGAYGVEVSDIVFSAKVFDAESGIIKTINKNDLKLGYRDSLFKKKEGKNLIIVSVVFCFKKNKSVNISYKDLESHFSRPGINSGKIEVNEVRDAVLNIRMGKLPPLNDFGTAGSFFKNPIVSEEKAGILKAIFPDMPVYKESDGRSKISAAFLIDKVANLKGFRIEDAGVYERQALVLINYGRATAKEIFNLSEEIKRNVAEKTGIFLEREVELVGEF